MKKFRVNEVFSSIQGEGPLVGSLAIFIRFAGCNLKCKFCDTNHEPFEEFTHDELLSKVKALLTKMGYSPETTGFKVKSELQVILTGGEPLLQVTKKLVEVLADLGLLVCVETNGSDEILNGDRRETVLNLLNKCAEVVVSPKVRRTSKNILERASCLKVLCPVESVAGLDEKAIRDMVRQVGRLTDRVFQPVTPGLITHQSFKEHFESAIHLAMKWGIQYDEDWRVIPQVHKFLDLR